MADRNLEIALRIKADLESARKQLDDLTKSVKATGDTSKSSADLLGAAGKRIDEMQAEAAMLNKQLGQTQKVMDTTATSAKGLGREVVSLGRNLASGDISGAASNVAALGTNSRTALGDVSALRLGVGLTVLTLAALAAMAVKGYLEAQTLDRALIATGNYAGTTGTQMRNLAIEVGATTGRYGDARRAILLFAQSGQVTAASMNDATRAAVAMSALTGQSIDKSVASILRLGGSPAQAVKALDDQFHFLTTTTYLQIQALQDHGREAEADALTMRTLADTLEQRQQRDTSNLGIIQRAYRDLHSEISRGISLIKQWGSADLGQQIDQLYLKIGSAQNLADSPLTGNIPGVKRLAQQRIDSLYAQVSALRELQFQEQKAAETQGATEQTDQAGKAGADVLHAAVLQYRSAAQKYADRVKELKDAAAAAIKAAPKDTDKINADLATALAGAQAQFERTQPKAAVAKDTTNALAAAQQQLQNQILSLGNTALGPVTGIWDQYTKAMLAASAAGGKAIAAGGDVAAVQAQVSQVQTLAAQARDRALADQSRGLNIAFLQATGQQGEAARLQIEAQYGDLLADLQRRGDEAGVRLVKSLINVGEARAQLQQLQQQVDQVLAGSSRQEQSIQAEQQAGLISEYSARKQILDLHQATATQLDQLIPKMRELVAATGDPRAVEQLKNLEAELGRLKLQTNDLKTAFESGLTSGLEQALEGLATRTMTVGEAFKTLARTVIQSLAQVAARALAAKAIDALGNLFGGGDKNKDIGQGATKLALAGGVVGGAAALLGSNADKLQAAATTLLIANSIGSVGGFAEGGYTGHGGKYQVAGVVHRGEGVLNQREIAALGGPSGFYALRHAIAYGYADGGYVNPLNDAPRLPTPIARTRLPTTAANDARPGAQVALRNVNVIDPALVRDYLDSGDGETSVMNIISRNETKIRQIAR